ncbi:MAG: hypothetical protein LBS93_03155 [Synergistaceae bacterium]|jgi:hypothetical protein|nr:hypothetical protein [Synergistaceae bacterium]
MSHGNKKRSVRFLVLLSAAVIAAVVFASAAFAADQSFKAKSGISFNYPSGWTATEVQQGSITSVTLMNPSQPTATIAVTISEGGVPENTPLPDEEATKAALAASGQDFNLLTFKNIKVAGKDAVLSEFSTEANGVYVQSRSVTIIDGTNMIAVSSVYMDKSTVADGQKISEAVENSLSF